jgi:hypothetical protein
LIETTKVTNPWKARLPKPMMTHRPKISNVMLFTLQALDIPVHRGLIERRDYKYADYDCGYQDHCALLLGLCGLGGGLGDQAASFCALEDQFPYHFRIAGPLVKGRDLFQHQMLGAGETNLQHVFSFFIHNLVPM